MQVNDKIWDFITFVQKESRQMPKWQYLWYLQPVNAPLRNVSQTLQAYQAQLAALASRQQQQLPKPSPQTFRLQNQQLQNITESTLSNPTEEEAIILSKEEDIEESDDDELDDTDMEHASSFNAFLQVWPLAQFYFSFLLAKIPLIFLVDNSMTLCWSGHYSLPFVP